MALILAATSPTQTGCFGFTFTDTTGVYNVTTNPGGYGNPNLNSNNAESCSISIYAPGSTVAYVFDFTMNTGNFDTATVTAPDGTVTDILTDVATTQRLSFPFSTDFSSDSLLIDETWIGGTTDESITDGVYTIVYEVIGATPEQTYNTTVYTLSKCNACCCITKAYANLNSNCGCDDNGLKSVQRANAFLSAAVSAAELGMYEASQTNVDKALEICQGNCSTC